TPAGLPPPASRYAFTLLPTVARSTFSRKDFSAFRSLGVSRFGRAIAPAGGRLWRGWRRWWRERICRDGHRGRPYRKGRRQKSRTAPPPRSGRSAAAGSRGG